MSERPDRTAFPVWQSFAAAHSRITDRLSADLESEVGLPLAWLEALDTLASSDQARLRMHQLADSLVLSRSAATRLIDRMEAAGLVERVQCLTDGRGTFVGLSASGRTRLDKAMPVHLRGLEEYFDRHLDDSERAMMRSVMSRLADEATPVAARGVS